MAMTAMRDIGRHLVQADRFAAGHAAIGDQLAVDRDDLHVGRPVGDRPVGDARHARAVIGDDAGGGDAAPDGEHEAPVEQPARPPNRPPRDCGAGFRGERPLAAFFFFGPAYGWTARRGPPRRPKSPTASRPRAGPSKVGSMRCHFPRCAMQSRVRPR